MSVDIFEVSTNYASDPVFMNLNDIAKHFIHALTKSIGVVVGDLSKMNVNITEHMTGGKLYNLLTTVKSASLIGDQELMLIANNFKASIAKSKMSSISNQLTDPIQHLCHFTKFFYIPVRLEYKTIPEQIRLMYLKVWLTTLIILMTNQNYYYKYTTIFPNIEVYKSCLVNLQADENIRAKMSMLPYDNIDNMLSNSPQPNNSLHIFTQIFYKLFMSINVEIIQKFCPNFNKCMMINPKYDGSWIAPIDPDINEQINKLRI